MAQTPNPSRRSWVGPAPIPFLTPRRQRHLEMRWADAGSQSSVRRSGVGAVADSGGGERDREANVQVVLRCRSLSKEEQRLQVKSIISCKDENRDEARGPAEVVGVGGGDLAPGGDDRATPSWRQATNVSSEEGEQTN